MSYLSQLEENQKVMNQLVDCAQEILKLKDDVKRLQEKLQKAINTLEHIKQLSDVDDLQFARQSAQETLKEIKEILHQD